MEHSAEAARQFAGMDLRTNSEIAAKVPKPSHLGPPRDADAAPVASSDWALTDISALDLSDNRLLPSAALILVRAITTNSIILRQSWRDGLWHTGSLQRLQYLDVSGERASAFLSGWL